MADHNKPGSLKQYYVAVGTLDAKLATLLDLIRAFESAAPLGLVVCCGARDSLDAVCSAALGIDNTRVWCLHANMSEREIDNTVQRFKASCSDPGSINRDGSLRGPEDSPPPAAPNGTGPLPPPQKRQQQQRQGQEGGAGGSKAEQRPLVEVLATTDVCLKVISKDLLPLSPTLLISYDLPSRKDVYLRRVTAVLGSRAVAGGRQRIGVHFAAAGQLEELRAVEGFAERQLQEMPVHVTDILATSQTQQPPAAGIA